MSFARAEPGATRVGWIGSGVMGRSMCGHVLDAGYAVTLYTRTREKAEPLLAHGARWADGPAAVAERSDLVFAIVGLPADVRQVFLGERGALAGAREGAILVDMTTSEPALAVEIAAAAQERGVKSLDAPVSGGDVGARNAALSIMVGGDAEAFDAALPVFETLGKTVVHQGPAGSGQHTKMVNQMLIAPMMLGVCEALLYAERAGLDPLRVIESVGSGAAGSWSVNNLGPRIVRRDFEPGVTIEHFLKDMGIALAEGHARGLALPGLELAERLYRELMERGEGRRGTQALTLALEKLAAER